MGTLVPIREIARQVRLVRGHKVMLSHDLAALYGVAPKALIQAVKRNLARFPEDFMFRLGRDELVSLRSQIVTLDDAGKGQRGAHGNLRSQNVTSSWGGLRYPPYAFTEQGIAMLSSVLRSRRAIDVNIEIMRAFVRLRELLAGNKDLARRLAALEQRYDAQFRVVFDAIRSLMEPPRRSRRTIGFALR
ncbi:MAG: ORF6N domain-containing protein [Myxococcaceae bacterium]|nr:ORF6N domain-containing protein [Myxococcaceae bacterium]